MDVLTGELLALDFINTRAQAVDGPVDMLDRVDDAERWLLLQAERLVPPDVVTAADLAALRDLRSTVRVAVDAARRSASIPADARAALNEAVRAAPSYVRLERDLSVTTHRDGDTCARLLAQLAESAVLLLGSTDISAVRQCEGTNCVVLFLPAHPRRRWCSPTRCGNRARVARYYRRHKPA